MLALLQEKTIIACLTDKICAKTDIYISHRANVLLEFLENLDSLWYVSFKKERQCLTKSLIRKKENTSNDIVRNMTFRC